MGRASNTQNGRTIACRTTEAFLLQLATLRPLGDNGYVTEHQSNVDID